MKRVAHEAVLLHPNGVNGLTGEYLRAEISASELVETALMEDHDAEDAGRLRHIDQATRASHFGLPFDADPTDPGSAGWGVVFSHDAPPALRAALQPLIEHRRSQIGDALVSVLEIGAETSWVDWLTQQGVAPGTVDPTRVPYYLLLVGSPTKIPFRMQYLLDVEYCVGRLDFDSEIDYRRYAESVVAFETGEASTRERVVQFFGTAHTDDRATELSANNLILPLAEGDASVIAQLDYRSEVLLGSEATKDALCGVLSGVGPRGRPSLLFSATHGIGGWPSGHPDQRKQHGALLCQDWSGAGSVSSNEYFAAADLSENADIHGLVMFCFACFGAGTPEFDDFEVTGRGPPTRLAADPFVAALPKALLAHPGGGALAVIGHVDRAWGYSFLDQQARSSVLPFQNAIGNLLVGRPVGYALNDLSLRYAALSTSLATVLRDMTHGKLVDDQFLAQLWTERNDAQNFILVGDPAVTLANAR